MTDREKFDCIPYDFSDVMASKEARLACERITEGANSDRDYSIVLQALDAEGICVVNGAGHVFIGREYLYLLE